MKRLNELEDMNKRLREGNTTPGEPGVSGSVQVIIKIHLTSCHIFMGQKLVQVVDATCYLVSD